MARGGQPRDLTGQRFGRLVALRIERKPGERVKWRCRCDCGNEPVVVAASLTKRTTKSCGCWNRQSAWLRQHKHMRIRLSPTREEQIEDLEEVVRG